MDPTMIKRRPSLVHQRLVHQQEADLPAVAALRVRDVHLTYPRGDIKALRGVSLDVGLGERVALLGPNGAGKSTLTHVVLGLLRPQSGDVQVLDQQPSEVLAEGELGAMLQDTGLMRDVRIGELVGLVTDLYGRRRDSREVLDEVGLAELARRPVNALSGGQRQRLKLALALAGRPKLLFLDEPTASLDIEARHRFWEVLSARVDSGATVLFTTHYMEEAEQFADRVVVLREGKVVADGTVSAVRSIADTGRITFRSRDDLDLDRLRALPSVQSVERRPDGEYALITTDNDATLPSLYRSVDDVRELSLSNPSLEDALVELFKKD